MSSAGAVMDASIPPPVVPPGGQGAISGGLLRPGAIDQGAFVQMLQQEQRNREAAGVGGRPVSSSATNFPANIPNLSPAQFAALVGAQADTPPPADTNPGAAADPLAQAPAVAPTATTLTGRSGTGAGAGAAAAPATSRAALQQLTGRQAAGAAVAGAAPEEDAPTFGRTAAPKIIDTPTTAAAKNGDAARSTGEDAAKAPPEDPNVVHLKEAPDRETQRNLMAQHKRWIVDETPGARRLFFGADGEFGWDDFLDVINPLQHIPIVAQIYRAVTGDEINGAAQLIGAIPLGPLGMIGTMGAVADLAVKDTTGKDIGDNLEAMLFGPGPKGSAAPGTADNAAAAAHPDLSLQTASAAAPGARLDIDRQLHDQCRG